MDLAMAPPPVQNPFFAISDAESAFDSNAESDAESDFDTISLVNSENSENFENFETSSRFVDPRDPDPASIETYSEIMEYRTAGDKFYEGKPLMDIGTKARGDAVELIVRRHDKRDCHPDAIFLHAQDSLCSNGARRGSNATNNDYDRQLSDEPNVKKNVEVKSAIMCYDITNKEWKVEFQEIKPWLHNELRLALVLDDGVHIFVFKGPVPNAGRKKFSSRIQEPHAAGRALLERMSKKCTFVGHVAFDDPNYADLFAHTTVTSLAFRGVPLAARGEKSRGTILERIARRHGELCHPDSTFEDPDPGVDKNGKKRGKGAAKNDYNRDGAKQEAKSAQLKWDKFQNRWEFQFKNIKKDLHDDLVLVFYTPTGVHIYVHDGVLGVSTTGKATTTKGTKIVLCGPCGVTDPAAAWDAIRAKLEASGCEHQGSIFF